MQMLEKLETGFYSVRHLFRANDSSGQGIVSREALRHIMFAMLGYIDGYQFNKFLKRHGLDNMATIPFDTFVACFQENENSTKMEWMSPYQKASMEKKSYPEEHLRNIDFWTRDTTYQSGTFSFSAFKQKAREKNFDLTMYLPGACFRRGGKVIPPQLREAMALLGLRMTNEEFHKVWDRFDWEGVGAIKTRHLLKILGLGSEGKPEQRAQSCMGRTREKSAKSSPVQLEVTNSAIWKDEKEEKTDGSGSEKMNKSPVDTEEVQRKKSEMYLKQIKRTSSTKIQPRLENILDCLIFRFEEPYNLMLAAFQLFDHKKRGYVSKIDFRRVLLEFGYNVPLTELDVFFMRCNLQLIKGEVNYIEFLSRYQSKGEGSLTHKIITGKRFQNGIPEESSSCQELSAEDLEVQLVLFLHGEFIRFVRMLRKYDVHDVNVITQYELCDVLDKFLGYQLSHKQFSQLVKDIGQQEEGLVPYHRLLQAFTSNAKEWNKKLESGRSPVLKQASNTSLVAEEEGEKTIVDVKQQRENVAAVEELESKIGEMLKRKLHIFDKNFKHMDRRKIEKVNRLQFKDLMKSCGINLHPEELLLLWSSLGVRPEDSIGYTQLLAHYMKQGYVSRPNQHSKTEVAKDIMPVIKRAKTFVPEKTQKISLGHEDIRKVRRARTDLKVETVRDVERKLTYDKTQVEEAVRKIEGQVIDNWDFLKKRYRQLDANGFATIPVAEMKILLSKITDKLTADEVTGILQKYDTKKNGRFAYMDFMMQCKQSRRFGSGLSPSGSRCSRPQTAPAGDFREPVQKCLLQFQKQVLARWKSVRQAFKALDVNSDGYVDSSELRRILTDFGISSTEGNTYHLMSEFDTNMDGKISYNEFLEQCLLL
ncbi:EF-hand calcium-binding domain-containing protein 6-like isoform X2 [Liolophura sinensis]